MRTYTFRVSALVFFLILLPQLLPSAEATNNSWSGRIPVLTVKDSSGSLSYVKLQYSRDPDATDPLSIAISEQLPQASGDALRASIWQAAMVAAIERKDPLQGVSLHFSIPGQIDGPSAGCAFALAIICAIDGKPFPTNVAVTGSILPDGTIGRVGGVHLKIMAARLAGMNNILVPDYLRLEIDPEKSATVDIKLLARLVGMKFIPVATISEAYARLHGSLPAAGRSEDNVDLPDSLETFFRNQYDLYGNIVSSIFSETDNAISASNQITWLVSTILSTSQQADRAANMGYFDVAANLNKQAANLSYAYFQTLNEIADKKTQETLDSVVIQKLKTSADPLDIARKAKTNGLSNAGIQFIADISEGRAFSDYIGLLTLSNKQRATDIQEASSSKDVSKEDIESAEDSFIMIEFTRLFLANYVNVNYEYFLTNAIDIDALLSYPTGFHVSPQAGAENLFYSTYLASKTTLDISLNAACQEAGVDPQQYYFETIIGNPDAAAAFGTYPTEGHDEISRSELRDREYLSAVLSLSYITAITQSSRLLMSLVELDPTYGPDGSVSYGRTGLLHHLLRNARKRAIDSVLNCRDKGLPWVAAAIALREADFSRDDPTVDKASVLAKYWQASLQANSMALLVQPDKSTRIQSRRPLARGARIKEVLPNAQTGIKALRPGDIITQIDNVRITDIDELIAIVASMPKKKRYEIRFTASANGKDYIVKADGGQMLGVSVETIYAQPQAASVR